MRSQPDEYELTERPPATPELPWKCVALQDHHIVPRYLPNGQLHPSSLSQEELDDPETLEHTQCCVHVDEPPGCTLQANRREANPILCPVISTDQFIYEKSALSAYCDELEADEEAINLITQDVFYPQTQYWVRLASSRHLTSKLDPDRRVDFHHPLVATFENEQQQVIVTESMDGHGCGQLRVYRLDGRSQGDRTRSGIEARQIDGIAYASIDQWRLVSNYFDLSVAQLQARIEVTTPPRLRQLEQEVERDQQALGNGQLVYQTRRTHRFPVFLSVNPLTVFSRKRRYDGRSWALSVLERSGMLPALQASVRYEIRTLRQFNGSLFNPRNSRSHPPLPPAWSPASHCRSLFSCGGNRDHALWEDDFYGGAVPSPIPRYRG